MSGRYDRKISDRFFWFAGAGWDRNEFAGIAGIRNRYTGGGGVGNFWADSESLEFRTDYTATYAKQDDVVRNPRTRSTRTTSRSTTTSRTSPTTAPTWSTRLPSMNKRLALKVTIRWLYDNRSIPRLRGRRRIPRRERRCSSSWTSSTRPTPLLWWSTFRPRGDGALRGAAASRRPGDRSAGAARAAATMLFFIRGATMPHLQRPIRREEAPVPR